VLHDRTGPNLAAIGVNLCMLEQQVGHCVPAIEQLFQETQALLADTITEIREMSAELRPARLDYAGLVPALRDRLERFRRRTALDVQLDARLPDTPLAPAVEWTIFRVIDEALNNCAKHARATHVLVDLHADADRILVHVRDDGVGFDPATVGQVEAVPGMGLLTMRERVEDSGGRLEILAEPGQGTHLRAAIPLQHVAGNASRTR